MTIKLLHIGLFLCLLFIPIEIFHKPIVIDIRQARCLATVVYHEARGEPVRGRLAVASVALRRAAKHGMDVCHVVAMPAQFSWYRLKPDMLPVNVLGPLLYDAHLYIESYRDGTFKDVTNKATHFAHKDTKNYWTVKFKHTITIGHHKFYKEVK